MKHRAVIALALFAGCSGSRQAAEEATMLAQARELIALTQEQVDIPREQVPLLEKDAGTTPTELEIARLGLDAAEAELKQPCLPR